MHQICGLPEPWFLIGVSQWEDRVRDQREGGAKSGYCSQGSSLTVTSWLLPSGSWKCCQAALSTQRLWEPILPLVPSGQWEVRAPHACQPQGSVQALLGFHLPAHTFAKRPSSNAPLLPDLRVSLVCSCPEPA